MNFPKQHIIGTCKDCIHRSPSGHCENDMYLVPEDEAYGSFEDTKSLIVQAQAPIEGIAFWVGPDFGCSHWEHKGVY